MRGPRCTEQFDLSHANYSQLRSSSIQFAVLPGHERLEIERVIEQRDGYYVVEKIGEGATVAAEQWDDADRENS